MRGFMKTSDKSILKQCPTLKFSVADFLVNLLALQEKDEDLKTLEALYFSKLHGFSKTKSPKISYSKTLKAYLTTTVEELSQDNYLKSIKLNFLILELEIFCCQL